MAKKPTFPKGMPRRDNASFKRTLRQHAKRMHLPEALPLVHTTTVWGAEEIAGAGRLTVRHCDVFLRNLVFFFVMRPAYRSKYSDEPSHQLSRFPVAFILPPRYLPAPFHVYPIDTGGAAKGAFHSQADPQVPLEDYALVETLEAASGHIEWAFGSLDAYMRGDIRPDLLEGVDAHDHVTRGYADIARMGRKGSNEFDRRSSAVEVAFDADITLDTREGLVILPRQMLDNAALIDRLKGFGFEIEAYDWRPSTLPDEYEDDIAEAATAWYRAKGWLT
ncbi:MAG: hypothetical protein ACK4VY_09765 [Brevundimonas sp.]